MIFIPSRYKHLLLISRQINLLLQKGITKDQALLQLQTNLGDSQTAELRIIEQLLDDKSTEVTLPVASGPLTALKLLINPVKKYGGDVVQFFSEFNKIFLNQNSLYYIKNYDTSGIMLYLVSLILIASGVVTIYSIYVFPSLQTLFSEANSPLPPLSQFVFTLLLDWGVVIAISVVILIVLFISIAVKIKHTVSNLALFGELFLRIPGFKSIAAQYNLYLNLRFLQILINSGITQENSLTIINDLAKDSNTALDKQLLMINSNCVDNLIDFPLALAATMNNLNDEINFQIDTLYEKAITDFSRLKDTISFIGIVIVATVIGNLILAMYMPIFQMGKIVGGQ
jgi:type IV pilus assembly protein PilC